MKGMSTSTITVILVRTKHPENVGSVARVCANMGCQDLILVDPRHDGIQAAQPLATSQGRHLLETMRIEPDLVSALSGCHAAYAVSARVGGWRKIVQLPEQAAQTIMTSTSAGRRIGLVFGPEDKGLTNQEIELCGPIISIPTIQGTASLNLSQAVLVVLYECFKLAPLEDKRRLPVENGRHVTHRELHTLYGAMKSALQDIDFLKSEHADYFMMPLKRFMNRLSLREHEYNLLMGICRQIRWMASSRAESDESDP